MSEPGAIEVHLAEGIELPLEPERLRHALELVLAREGAAVASLSLAVVGDDEIARLNSEYLGHEGPTDVISFALHSPGEPVVGDLYLGAEQAARQAAEYGVGLAEELLRLAIHGTLHLLGHDHPEGDDRLASPMYRRQEELLAELSPAKGEG